MTTPLDTEMETRLNEAAVLVSQLRAEIGKALVGQEEVLDQVLVAFLAGGHVLLEGVPGLGKTLLVRALARTFSGTFSRIQFTPDLMPSDVTGHAVYDPKSESFHLRRGPIFTHLLLADEVNRAPAKTQSALLEAMQEQQVSLEGESMKLPAPFMVLATQNPIEQEGTYPLPEAQLDRFLFKVLIQYPGAEEERALVRMVTDGRVGDTLEVDQVSVLAQPDQILGLQQLVAQVRVDEAVLDYAVRLVRATRDWPGISIGAGPRGGLSLVRAARAKAVLEGRAFATPDDVKTMSLPTLRHRIARSPETEIEGLSSDDLLRAIVEKTPAPRQ